jgi:sugar lactone lactonase YvrE
VEEFLPKLVLDVRAELGECPLWSVEEQRLYWLDIENSAINRFDPQTGKNQAWSLPSIPGCFAFREGGGAVVAAGDGIYDFDFNTGLARYVSPTAHDPSEWRFNDGRTDRQGRLWAGTVHARLADVTSISGNAYYRYDGRSVEKMIESVGVTNGTAFSPDGKIMYRAQTETGQIFAYDFDPVRGTTSNGRVFAVIPADLGLPDGATIDTKGGYWVALPARRDGGKGGMARYTPEGRLDFYFELPVPVVTMPAFGGPDMSTLYITTARLEAWVNYTVPELAGSIFAVDTKFRGVPETAFRFPYVPPR